MAKAFKISFIIPTYNASRYLRRCLASIRNQDYPSDNVEILLLDAGSQDRTLDIAKSYNCRILENKQKLAEYGVQLGILNSEGELVVVFAADNELKDNDWIAKVSGVFEKEDSLAAAWCLLGASDDDAPLNKYFALIQSDPLSFFLNKNLKSYLTGKLIKRVDGFSLFKVEKDMPLVWGANGLTYRKEFVREIWSQDGYLGDNDAFQIMIASGKNQVAYSQDLIVYHHHVSRISDWIKKWRRNYRLHFLDKLTTRNLDWVFIPHFNLKLIAWLIYSLCPLFSGLHSLYLIFKDKKIYWAYHPVVSFLQTSVYAYITLTTGQGRSLLKNLIVNNLKLKKENTCIS